VLFVATALAAFADKYGHVELVLAHELVTHALVVFGHVDFVHVGLTLLHAAAPVIDMTKKTNVKIHTALIIFFCIIYILLFLVLHLICE
jgi:hypothetical protein